MDPSAQAKAPAVTGSPVPSSPITDHESYTPVTGSPVQSPPHPEAEYPTPLKEPVTSSPVRSPLLDSAVEYPTHHERDNSSSFRSLLRDAEDSAAPPPAVRSPPRKTDDSLPLRSLLQAAEHRTASPPTHHQKENSLSSASSFKSFKSPLHDLEDQPTSPPRGGAMGMTVASILKSPVGAEVAAGANRMVAKGTPAPAVKGGRVVRRPEEVARAAGWLRISALVLSLVSFSVMASDKTSGWAGDSYDRYREFRYCLSVNVIVFVYSLFQVYVQIHHMCKKQRVMSRWMSYFFDFTMDQILAYLLMSASSAAASRNGDWISNFGSDEFTRKINGSVAMSFLTFFTLALSSLISAYKLFSWN